jgi:hypothetical protein
MDDSWSNREHQRDKMQPVDTVRPALTAYVADFPWLSAKVMAVVSDGAGASSISVCGDFSDALAAGQPIQLCGSTANDGGYRVSSSSYDSSTNQTTLEVYETVPSSAADGSVYWPLPLDLAVATATAGSAGSGSFAVSGNYVACFLAGWQIDIGRSADNSGTYTLASAPSYNSTSNETTFAVVQAVPSSTADGYLKGHYPSPSDVPAPVAYPAALPAVQKRNPLDSSPVVTVPTVPGTQAQRIYPPGQYIPRGSLVRGFTDGRGLFPASVLRTPAFLFAGGPSLSYGPGGPTGSHCRLDPATGAVLWVANRGAQAQGLVCDVLGKTVTCGLQVGGTSTHELWDADGNQLWQATITNGPGSGGSGTPIVSAVAVGSDGSIYTGSSEPLPTLRKWGPGGTQITTGSWPVTNLFSLGASNPVNAIAVDPLDGRVAIAFGTVGPGSGVGWYQVLAFNSDGSPFALDEITNPALANGIGGVAFDLQGNLWCVGGGSIISQSIGYVFDRTGAFRNYVWWMGNTVGTTGHAVAIDGLGRALVGAQSGSATVLGEPVTVWPYAAGVMLPGTVTTATQNQFLFHVAPPVQIQRFLSAATDHGGHLFLAGNTLTTTQGAVYAFDPLGNPIWMNSIFAEATSINGDPLLVAAS